MGKSFYTEAGKHNDEAEHRVVVCGENPNVYGSYVHGLFDFGTMAGDIVKILAKNKGIEIRDGEFEDYQSFKEKQYDKLADILRMYMNMEEVYGMLREANLD